MFLLTFLNVNMFFRIIFKFCTYMHNWDKTLQNLLDFKNSLDKKNKRVVKICRFPLMLNIFTLSVFVNSTFVMINISRHEIFASNISPHLTFFTQKDIFSSAILDSFGLGGFFSFSKWPWKWPHHFLGIIFTNLVRLIWNIPNAGMATPI